MESLYRKYRPLTFDGVVGQQHIVSTLEHAVTEGRLSHAYLFCGPRGTGKTTMARILAKSLLCEHAAAAREGGASGCLPDGTCEECRQIAEGTHPDVYELDAASRTGVDNVREEIIGSVNFAPVRGAYKVYIIDEVHMLTTAAFNALLKTLEEPPAHVVFVMCTTDPQKIPETILSRCQRFEFHRIGNADIQGRLAYICGQEGFTYDDEALRIVAKHARGGMRDALSTLEQLSVFGNGAVTLEDARALLGEVPGEILSDFARAIAARDVVALFGLVRDQVNEGSDLMELTRDLVAHVRDIYMVRVAGAGRGIIDGTPDEAAALSEEASLFEGGDRLARALTVLDDAVLEMRNASDTRLVLEIALTRLSRPESDLTLEALAERIDRLEARLAGGAPAPAAARDRAVAVPAPSPSTEGEGGAGAKRPDDAGAASDGSLPWSLPAAAPRSSSEARPADSAPFVPFTQAKSSRPARTAPAMPPQPVSGDEPPRCARGGASTAADGPRRAEADSGTSSDPAAPVVPSGASAAEVAASSAPSTPAVRDDGELQRRWAEVVKLVTKRNPPRGGLLLNSRAKSDDGAVLTVGLPAGSGFAAKMLAREDSREAIMPVVASVFGSRRIQYEMARDGAASVKQGAPASPRPASGSSSSPMAAAPQERSATAPVPADELSAADSSEDGRARVDAAPIPGKPAAPAAGEGAGPDQSTGPTVLPEPDVEADRRAWEDDVVPYDDDMIAEIEGSDPAFAPGPTEADAALEPIRLEPAAPAPVVPGSSAPAASPVEEGAPAAPAPSPLAGINFVGGAAPEEGHAPTMEEAGDVLDAVFGGHTFLGHDGWGAPSQDDPE